MSLTRKIAYNTLAQLIGKAVGMVLALVTVGFLTRYLGTEGFGEYSTVIVYLGLFGIFADLGLYMIATREISKEKADVEKILSNIFTLRIFSAILCLSLAPIIAIFLPYSGIVKIGILIGAMQFFLLLLIQVLTGLFQKNLQMDKVALAEIAGRVIFLGLVLLAINKNFNLLFIVTALTLGSLVNFFIIFLFTKKHINIHFAFNFKLWKYILTEASPLALAAVLNLVYYKFNAVMLSLMKPPHDIGIYQAAFKVIEVFVAFPSMFMGLVMPYLSKYTGRDKFKIIFRKASDFMITVTIPTVAGLIFFASQIVNLIGGPEFVESDRVLRILALGMGAMFISNIFGYTVVAIKKQKLVIWFYLLAAVVAIVGNLFLIPKFTYIGTGWVAVITELLILIGTGYIVKKYAGIFLSLKTIGKSILAVFCMCVVLYFLRNLNFVILIILGGAVYFVALYFARGISKDVLKEFTKLKGDSKL